VNNFVFGIFKYSFKIKSHTQIPLYITMGIYIYILHLVFKKMNSYPILNKYEDIICIKMNQNNKFIILLIIYIVLLNIFRPIFQSILYIIKKKGFIHQN
jgi:hypothetical protein